MEIYTPAFNKVRELIQEDLLKYIAMNITADIRKINKYFYELKEEKIGSNRDYELIDFTYSSPYSPQIEDLIVDLIRCCLIDEGPNGYRLTSLGLKMIDRSTG